MPKSLKRETLSHKARRRRLQVTGAGILAALLVVILAIAMTNTNDSDPATQAVAPSPPGEEWTTETFTGGPRLAVDRTDIAYGNVDYGDPVEAVYRLRNVGDEVATIDEVNIKTLEGC